MSIFFDFWRHSTCEDCRGHIRRVDLDDTYAYFLCTICGAQTKLKIAARGERVYDPANKSRGWGPRAPDDE
jgi:hypothetical protein